MRARQASALARDTRGSTLVEFAFVAPVLCLFMIGGFDIAHTLYMRATLQGVVQKSARDSALETNNGTDVQDAIDLKITNQVHQLANNATVAIDRVAYRTFDAAKKKKPEDYTDTNGNGTCDAGEPYVDANNSGGWEANGGVAGQGGARDKTVYTVTVTYPRMFPLNKYIGLPAEQTLVATTVLQNQPYSDQAAVGTAVLQLPMNRIDAMTPLARGTLLRNLAASRSGVAMLEFAFALPIFVTMFVGGSELANYVTTRMRVSQVALQIADNAARIGAGSPLAAKTITETDINDLFIGAQLQSGGLNLATNGRVILSDLEPVANPNTTNRYKIVWQRCYGAKTKASDYGISGQTNMTGMGPATRLVTAQDDNATMFVQVYYEYKPLISLVWMPTGTFNEIASMAVRDRRDLSTGAGHLQGIYNTEGATVANC